MTRKLLVLASLVMACASFAACGKHGGIDPCLNPLGPSCEATPHTQQPPTENGFEPLGTRHYLTDSNGNATRMWTELVRIVPLRGSRVITAPFAHPPDCSIDCYSVTVRFGVDADPSSSSPANADFKAGFTVDGIGPGISSTTAYPGPYTPICFGTSSSGNQGECGAGPGAGPGGSTSYTTFEFVPTYVTVVGQLRVGNGISVVTVGRFNFMTGYQHL